MIAFGKGLGSVNHQHFHCSVSEANRFLTSATVKDKALKVEVVLAIRHSVPVALGSMYSSLCICLFLAFFLLILATRAVFHHCFHPLNRFCGPRLARWTRYYMAYYDVVKGGAWIEQLQKLHQMYGPVVRVAPNELHFSNPRAYGDIYSATSKCTKDPNLYDSFPQVDSIFPQTDPREVSARRPLIAPFFSKQAVQTQVEGTIKSIVDQLINQLTRNHGPNQTPANLYRALRSTTFDIITTYCFAESVDAVHYPGFHHNILYGMDFTIFYIPLAKHFRVVKFIVRNMPEWLAPVLNPSLKSVVGQMKDVETMVDKILLEPDTTDFPHRTIFHTLLEGSRSGEHAAKRRSHSVTKKWLVDEGLLLRLAGSDNVGNACVIGCRCILANPRILTKLVNELDDSWPDKNTQPKFEDLEKLSYLTAVIKESLRLSHGTTSPLTRIVGAGGATIAGQFVPEGTSVAIANSFVHLNPDIFPEPERFYPERWLQPDSRSLEKYLVAFGKGPRSCIGIKTEPTALPSKYRASESATVHAAIVPLSGAVLRYRAHACRTSASYGLGGLRVLRRTYEIQGWAGLFKGVIPTILGILVFRGCLMLVKVHPTFPLVVMVAPQISLIESPFFILISAMIDIPAQIVLVRSTLTPYIIPWTPNPFRALRLLFTPSERKAPWIIYFTPGLFFATILKFTTEFVIIRISFILGRLVWGQWMQEPPSLSPKMSPSYSDQAQNRLVDINDKNKSRSIDIMESPRVVSFLLAFGICSLLLGFFAYTVLLTPLRVINTRLAVQRNWIDDHESDQSAESEEAESYGLEEHEGEVVR
ncbi:hypothetical protein D9758_006134 [Tetrapyrgos nigripes]|uniref:Cytochrome P450 n=1 Tax=Tetrapyrgos nigripes TaxID=182062 RepID=A0A8H5GAV1_9AGAR|nr:hypothetical protein D9758_006134 [Tetrapyrgos nigripes]